VLHVGMVFYLQDLTLCSEQILWYGTLIFHTCEGLDYGLIYLFFLGLFNDTFLSRGSVELSGKVISE